MMSSEMINLNTISHNYDPLLEKKPDDVPSEKPSTFQLLLIMVFISKKIYQKQFFVHQRVLFVSP